MSNAITAGPNPTPQFGYAFNYAQWVPGTVVTLCNVTWNNDYRDIVQFPTTTGVTLDQYINGLETPMVEIDQISYIKPNIPIRINVPFNKAYQYNYLRAANPPTPSPVPGDLVKNYYYFILDARYVAPNTTELVIQLDVWQTFGPEVTFGNCYIDRGHIGIANENAFNNYGRDFLTVPEGLDYGGEYQQIGRTGYQLMKAITGYHTVAPGYNGTPDNWGSSYGVMGVSTVDITASPGTVSAPTLVTAKGSFFEGIPSGADIWYWPTVPAFLQFMSQNQGTPWVTQGVIAVTLIPDLRRYQPTGFFDSPALQALFYSGAANTGGEIWDLSGFTPAPIITELYPDWRDDYDDLLSVIPEQYQILKKFLTFPYMALELTTWTGKPIILKPESWNDANATIVEEANFSVPSQRVIFRPRSYNSVSGATIDQWGGFNPAITWEQINPDTGNPQALPASWSGGGDDGGDYLDLTTMIDNFPTVAMVNNGQLSYLAANFASIAYQQQSAAWAQQRALGGANTAYGQNAAGIAASKEGNAVGNAANTSNTAIANLNNINNQLVSGTAGVIGGLGGLISAEPSAAGLVSGVQQDVVGGITVNNNANAASQQTTNNVRASSQQNQIANRQAALVNDTNLNYAQYAAQGDYENAIAGVNAQIQGATMVQPTTSGQQGGDTFNLVAGKVGVSLRFKLIDQASIRTIGNFWLRYGYAVNQFAVVPASLLCMDHFSYWKLRETYITSSTVPESFKQAIRGIFEKGVTVWGDPSYIGNTTLANNTPLPGFAL